MSNFIVIEKDSLNKVSVNAERIVLSESSIVHTKMNRDDVSEFIRDGNNLILKLTNGQVVVIENFFVVDAGGVTSDLVFEEDGCVLYWFDGLSGFKEISGLEALLPAVEGSKLVGLLPWLVGAAVVGGAAAIIDHNDDDKKKDTTAPTAPTVEINDGGDGVINPTDLVNGKVTVTVKPTEPVVEGDKITITHPDGSIEEIEVTASNKDDINNNGITVGVTPAEEGEDTVVTAVVTDPQGNESPEGSDNSKVDLVVPGDVDGDGEKDPTGAPVVVIQDGGDDVINPSDVDENGKVDAIVTFPKDAGYSVGDTVVIKDQTGEVLVDRPLTAEDLENGIPVKATPADEGKDTVVTAVVTDPQGNESPEGKDNSSVDLVDGSITVDIDDADSTKITGTTTDVPPNSTVTLTIKTSIDDNGETKSFTTTVETDSDGNYSYTLTPEQGNATEVIAQVTDSNGIQREDTDQSDAVIKTDPTTDVDNGDNTVIGEAGNDVLAGDTGGLKTNFVAGANYNVSIVLDLSGSMYFGMDGTTPKNPTTGRDDYSPTGVLPDGMLSRLEIAKAGLKAFIAQMADHDGVINLQISTFSATNGVGNQSKWDKVFLDVTADNIDAIFEHIGSGKGGDGDGLTAGGGTNPELSFKEATDWFNSSEIKSNGYENQTYYITDGEPNTGETTLDNAFKPLAEVSKVFAVGVSSSVSNETVSRYDNTDVNGDKIAGTWNGNNNHGTAQAIADADRLIAYLIGGSENFIPADVGNDTVKGGAGDDILFGDAMNTNWITGLDPLQYPQYSGYSKLIAHLKAEVTGGAEPTQQEIYDFVKANFQKFVDADATDINVKGGEDIIYGGSGNDIIIAGAGDDRIYGGSGDDIISTGRGDDTIVYDLLNDADATGGNGTDTWIDYQANDKIEFADGFFDDLLSEANIADYIKVEDDGNGNAVLKVDRDGAAANGGTTHDWADLLIIEGKTASELQDLIQNQIIIG